MYLIKYNELGKAISIEVEPAKGSLGTLVNELPISIEEMLESKSIEQSVDNKKIYIIKGE